MDDLDLLRTLAPTVGSPTASERQAARAVLEAHIDRVSAGRRRSTHRWRRLPRLRRPVALALGALVIAGSLTAVVGVGYFGEWGPLDHPATAAQIDREIADTVAVTPLPPGYTYPDFRALGIYPFDTRFTGVQVVQSHAMCAWTVDWLAAHDAGNQAELAAAGRVIGRFPSWQSVSDPRLADDTVRTQIAGVVAGAQADDPQPIEALRQAMVCDVLVARLKG